MGKGICADCFVGNRLSQELFRLRMGGAAELPIDIRQRLDRRKKSRRKPSAKKQLQK